MHEVTQVNAEWKKLAAAVVAVIASACGSDVTPASTGVAIAVEPAVAELPSGASMAFTATVTAAVQTAVEWSVAEVDGGIIDTTGTYVAPTASFGDFHVVARAVADRNVSASAVVTVTPARAGCATAPIRTSGAVYYYCDCGTGAAPECVAGSDSNVGTSPAAPRRTIANAASRFNSMNAGDTVALCRGGAFDGDGGTPSNARCGNSESTYCDFRDYIPSWGSASSPRPRINPASGTNAFSLWATRSGGYGGFRFWNLDLRPARVYGGPKGFMILNDQHDIDICNVAIQGGNIGVQTDRLCNHITIRNSQFQHQANQAILAGCDYLTIDANTFRNTGDKVFEPGLPALLHTMYITNGTPTNPLVGVRVTNNYARNDPDGTWSVPGGGGNRGVMLIFRAYQNGTVIENNLVEGFSPYGAGGIALGSSSVSAQFQAMVIRRNRIHWGTSADAGDPTSLMSADACTNCIIEDNILRSERPAFGLRTPDQSHTQNSNAAVTTGSVVRNNTIHLSAGGLGLRAGWTNGTVTEGQDFIVENNAVWTASGSSCFQMSSPTAVGHPFAATTYPSTAANTAGNYCVNNGASAGVLWVDPPARNYVPVTTGPLVGFGKATSFSPVAPGTVTWSATDLGSIRAAPIDTGAMVH